MAIEQNVARFEIAMEDAFAMRVLHGPRYLSHERDAFPWIISLREASFCQAAAGRKFHAEEGQSIFALADFVDWQNVWMIKARSRLRFAPKAREGFVGGSRITQDSLDSDNATRMTLTRAINNSHSSSSNFFENFVVPKSPALVR
jgi:hypothetical protein